LAPPLGTSSRRASLRDRSLRITVERDLACSPAQAFGWVSDPDRMNEWSTAVVRPLRVGDGGLASGTGALREVVLPGPRPVVLREVVERVEAPRLFVYRVYAGAPLRSHRGTLRLEPSSKGTKVQWTIELEFPAAGLASVTEKLLLPELEKSLDNLVRVAGDKASTFSPMLPPARVLHEEKELGELFAAAETTLEAQRSLFDRLDAEGDPKRWFVRVYSFVTEAQIGACRRAVFQHPAWVLRVVPVFHLLFAANLERFERGEFGLVEAHWLAAFRATARDDSSFLEMSRGVFQGMRAHIEEDLPRALAHVFEEHYAGRADYARFRSDYLRMTPIFEEASRKLLAFVEPGSIPLRARLAATVLPREAERRLVQRGYYDIPRKRLEAFERGERIARMLIG
jgi:uncharacterized protein YndB with AHSA1/START domain